MNTSYMIDSIVQHTTVLIAQIATSAGVRAPLSHVAERVFLDLVREIERQGVARKVVADMFGLALRSYQQKVQRLSESATDQGKTLWEAAYSFVREREVVSRGEVMRRFRRDDDAIVKSVLSDLVESGLVYKTGHRQGSVYRIAPEEDLGRTQQGARGLEAALWFRVYGEGPVTRSALLGTGRASDAEVDMALDELVADGRIARDDSSPERSFRSERCFVSMKDDAAWGSSVVNHFQMVTSAICAKIMNGQTRALPDDQLGGSSYSFDVYPGHPKEAEVRRLLERMRGELGRLWDEVSSYNQNAGVDRDRATRVNFYFGQSVIAPHSNSEHPKEST